MRIALVSAEFSGTVSRGGIATYMRNLANMMADRGHDVHAFFAASGPESDVLRPGVTTHSVAVRDRGEFPSKVVQVFRNVHIQRPFDVIEGADFLAETAALHHEFPEIPLVLKLHTPGSYAHLIDYRELSLKRKLRFYAGGILRGKLSRPFWRHHLDTDYEWHNLNSAGIVTAPSREVVDALSDFWHTDLSQVKIIPNVFEPHAALVSADIETNNNTIAYFGRLEVIKGVLDLAAAIPIVLKKHPSAIFRFIGRSVYSVGLDADVGTVLRHRLKPWSANVEWIDGLPHIKALNEYEKADICVFPSLWDNFPNVCLEAMAAGRGVIGSSATGMASMITHGETGLLVAPHDPRAIAEAILQLIDSKAQRQQMGRAARAHVLKSYCADVVAPLQEAVYDQATRQVIRSRES